ncbi:MAG: hypothetical protein COV55_00285 [Candidatus Komeilibacteria bacterium CG11_big_fil_rev_8_21_14_0_20_36_20]|uniref:Uncharacterized protein n=1 Tax=Candidatus Komeilibacteria bacterium CG11_big_fil_rev_8_21_14_0_20_36_20 TaxID=1974477 RepID=A0A2H0NGX2_9BACT|nr:MAG: hypothetical protein COV55_00285 [Candidatus Komeilibacteria bacterium CG11_big_fil_rev_8_21_14_0_20_36_20]PIR81549.1 MAG: hypothetical protein COU21_03170 [Candidatus Komeilibacteria bacterium CG10_big_fil_rev_8_21_14_0_10_36_65]PJC55457.1 MAG: hypothetical protein CO027_02010 [Candidatus Komeilibacteria bacterium CG_4_9_14_0_2_um_filter_36_13]
MENNKKPNKRIGWFVALVIIVAAIFWWQFKTSEIIYNSSTELEIFNVPVGQTVVFKDGPTITVKGDTVIDGELKCDDGPLLLTVEGKLTVNGKLTCALDDGVSEDNLGNGINIVAKGEVEFNSSAVVQTNGHLQLVDDENKLASTQEAIDQLYNDAGEDSGEGLRIGPMIPIDLAPGQVAFSNNKQAQVLYPNIYVNQNNLAEKFKNVIIPSVQAEEAAKDIAGNDVADTVKIGGLWVVGRPVNNPPGVIDMPTPPEGIKKIIIAYNFGGRNMNIADLILFGPDGRPGAEDKNACDVKGDDGQNAFRLNIQAPSVTINNFSLHLGSGGFGGNAETDKDCDPGQAMGGQGAEAGNFKITGSNRFQIVGAFDIFPGAGGAGGKAIAHGKDGKNPGEKGGNAIAQGGQGAANKKGAKVTGEVSGLDNVTIAKIVAGRGGDALAEAGRGGDGKGCKSNGGEGGKASANAGNGGAATSRTAESTGGNGGDAEAIAGRGGDGGDCDPKDDGGKGGNGGEAAATAGTGGTGKTTRGNDGIVKNEIGGDGGDGGDGCLPGKGGKEGNAVTLGKDGADGKNLCILVQDEPLVDPEDPGDDGEELVLNPSSLVKKHVIGVSSCPDPFDGFSISGPAGGTWNVEGIPQWLNIAPSGSFGPVPVSFNCNITDFTTHQEAATLYFSSGEQTASLLVQINVSAE